jgi:hypothetical protein
LNLTFAMPGIHSRYCRYSSAPISEVYLQIWMWWITLISLFLASFRISWLNCLFLMMKLSLPPLS